MPIELDKLRALLAEREQEAAQAPASSTEPPNLVERAKEPLPAPEEE